MRASRGVKAVGRTIWIRIPEMAGSTIQPRRRIDPLQSFESLRERLGIYCDSARRPGDLDIGHGVDLKLRE
jgi:hypothetical protein